MPDISTLRMCSVLASAAFAAVFAVLWHGRRSEPWLAFWGGSSALYAVTLIGLGTYPKPSPLVAGMLFAALGTTNMLMLAGVRSFDGVKPVRLWMLAIVAAGGLVGVTLGSEGTALGRIANAASLVVSITCFGLPLVISRADDGTRTPRRIAGTAMLAYVPGFLISIWCELYVGHQNNWLALVPMLSDQLLLGILNLSLLAIPGQRSEQALRRAALHDPLTGAWNRAALQMHEPRLAVPGTAVILIDVDHFKSINDRNGHAVGDAVLIRLAQTLDRCAKAGAGRLVRLGGDEFLVAVPNATDTERSRIAEHVRSEVGRPFPGLPACSVSIGVSVVEAGEKTLDAALARADSLMYRAKDAGRNRIAA
jgi:diguanylate cyclase (GGDEF)-like protein